MRKRNRRVEIYFTDEELASLKNKVAASCLSREAFCRQALLNSVVLPRPNADLHKFTLELRYIGNNINQVVATAHTQGFVNTLRLKELTDMLWSLEQKVLAEFTEA